MGRGGCEKGRVKRLIFEEGRNIMHEKKMNKSRGKKEMKLGEGER